LVFCLIEELLEQFKDLGTYSFNVAALAVGNSQSELGAVDYGLYAVDSSAPPIAQFGVEPLHAVQVEMSSPSISGQRQGSPHGSDFVKEVWQNFFSNPTQWWNNRFDKRYPRAPNFCHKVTHKGLWIVDCG
jgi:hypothetical protein